MKDPKTGFILTGDEPLSPRRDAIPGIAIVLGIGVILGCSLGLTKPQWQRPVECGQAIAGLVKYPNDNPFYEYHLQAWSGVNQVAALLLECGLGERTISILFSMLEGTLFFTATGLFTLVLTRSATIALVLTLLTYSTDLYYYGLLPYPVLIYTEHTYGSLGMWYTLLCVAVLALPNCHALGWFMVGLAPAAHPAWGCWLMLIVPLATIYSHGIRMPPLLPSLAFGTGLLLTVASFLVQSYLSRDLPRIPTEVSTEYTLQYINNYDQHRRSVRLLRPIIASAVLTLLLTGFELRKIGRRGELSFLYMVLFSAAATGLLACAASRLGTRLPLSVLRAMPWRHINFTTFTLPLLVMWLLLKRRGKIIPLLLLTCSLAALVSPFYSAWHEWPLFVMDITGSIFLVYELAMWWGERKRASMGRAGNSPLYSPVSSPSFERVVRFGFIAYCAAALLFSLVKIGRELRHGSDIQNALRDSWESDPFFRTSGQRPGLLLVSPGCGNVQLRLRRAVLLPSQLNQIPYIPASGPSIARILKEVYGLDFFDPAKSKPFLLEGREWSDAGMELWEHRDVAKWQKVRQEFGVTDVFTWNTWALKLPLVTENNEYRLYHIPGAEEATTATSDRAKEGDTESAGQNRHGVADAKAAL